MKKVETSRLHLLFGLKTLNLLFTSNFHLGDTQNIKIATMMIKTYLCFIHHRIRLKKKTKMKNILLIAAMKRIFKMFWKIFIRHVTKQVTSFSISYLHFNQLFFDVFFFFFNCLKFITCILSRT